MKIDKILQLFVVKEKRFFPLYIKSAENILKAAGLLFELTKEEDPDDRRIYARRIKECETEGDTITHAIIDALYDAYVTPFDRDDVHNLAQDMDSFVDYIRDASKKFAIYQPKDNPQKLIEIAEYIVKDAEILFEITRHFDTMRDDIEKIDNLCNQMKDIEHIVDDIYESYMSNMFEHETDAVEIIKKKNIVQALEDTSDQAKDVSDTIRSIMVKMG